MFEDWAGVPKEDTASICFRNREWNDKSAHIDHADINAQQKNNVADNKPQDKNISVGDRYYLKEKNDVIPIYPKLNPGDRIKILPYELQPNKNREMWLEKWKNLCGCFVTIKEYDETEHGYLIEEINNCGWFPNELDYSTLICAENIQGNQTKVNSEYPQLFPGDKIMIKPFDQQPRNDCAWCFDAKSICGKVVTIKDYDEVRKVYHLEEISYGWFADEFDFSTLIRANTNNYQDITNPTKEDFDNLQPGDMVLFKSIEECDAQKWYQEAKNCCGCWVTIDTKGCDCYMIENNLPDGRYVTILFKWISAIRKKV